MKARPSSRHLNSNTVLLSLFVLVTFLLVVNEQLDHCWPDKETPVAERLVEDILCACSFVQWEIQQ